jgi:hypothetical protein
MKTLTIYPYLLGTTWVFDDPRTGLKEEAFVLGMSEMISRLVEVKGIPKAAKGISLEWHEVKPHPSCGPAACVVHVAAFAGGRIPSAAAFGLAVRCGSDGLD